MIDDNKNSDNEKGNELVRGHINGIILKALSEGEKYGYEIGKYIESEIGSGFSIKQPTLYSSLKRLEEKKIITSYWGDEDITNGGRRKYFRLAENAADNAAKESRQQNKTSAKESKTQNKPDKKFIIPKQEFNIINKDKDNISEKTKTIIPSDKNVLKTGAEPLQNQTEIAYAEPKNGIVKDNLNAGNVLRRQNGYENDSVKKDNEYKKIISKLLSGVKNETEVQSKGYDIKKDTLLTDTEPLIDPSRKAQEKDYEFPLKNAKPGLVQDSFFIPGQSIKKEITQNSPESNAGSNMRKGFIYDNGEISGGNINNNIFADNNIESGISEEADGDSEENNFLQRLNGVNGALKNPDEKSYSLLPSSSKYNPGSFEKLQKEMQSQGFNVRPHINPESPQKQFLLINKINFISLLFIFIVMALETGAVYYFLNPLIKLDMRYYGYALLILFLFPFFGTLNYVFYPNKKTKKRYSVRNSIISSLMVFMVSVLAIVSIALLFDLDINNNNDVLIKIIIPSVYAFNFILYSMIWGLLYGTKKCFI